MNLRPLVLLGVAAALFGAEELTTLRGKPHQEAGQEPGFVAASGTRYAVSGDADLVAQLGDARLAGREIEVQGRLQSTSQLELVRLFTLKEGKRYRVSYWCEICGTRLSRPAPCPNGHDVPAEPALQETAE